MLKGLSDFERQTIINGFKPEKKFSKGETIYAPSSFKRAIGYIVSGSATAFTDNNNGVVMKTFSEGMCFGAAAVFGEGDIYVSKITANEDCSVLFISEAELKGIFETCPAAAVNYINFLSDKIRFLNKKLKIALQIYSFPRYLVIILFK